MGWDRNKERQAGRNMAIGGCIFGLAFSIFWCILAVSIGASFMLIFGIPFAVLMGYRLIVCLRMSKEERQPKEPWEQPSRQPQQPQQPTGNAGHFCPYCGAATDGSFSFCPQCGRRLS